MFRCSYTIIRERKDVIDESQAPNAVITAERSPGMH
jgi:hypothetical protein